MDAKTALRVHAFANGNVTVQIEGCNSAGDISKLVAVAMRQLFVVDRDCGDGSVSECCDAEAFTESLDIYLAYDEAEWKKA